MITADDDNYICTFTTPNSDDTERAMDSLAECGIGREMDVVSISSIANRNASPHQTNETPTELTSHLQPEGILLLSDMASACTTKTNVLASFSFR